jgi:hypothetical protein
MTNAFLKRLILHCEILSHEKTPRTNMKTCKNLDFQCCTQALRRYFARIDVFKNPFQCGYGHHMFSLKFDQRKQCFRNATSDDTHSIQIRCDYGVLQVFIDNTYLNPPRFQFRKDIDDAPFALDCWTTQFVTRPKLFSIYYTASTEENGGDTKICYLDVHAKSNYKRRQTDFIQDNVHSITMPHKWAIYYDYLVLSWFDRLDRMLFSIYLSVFYASVVLDARSFAGLIIFILPYL